MLDGCSSLFLVLISVVVVVIVIFIGTIGMMWLDGSTPSHALVNSTHILCGRGKDIEHPIFSVFFYIIAWLTSGFLIGVIATELAKRCICYCVNPNKTSTTIDKVTTQSQ